MKDLNLKTEITKDWHLRRVKVIMTGRVRDFLKPKDLMRVNYLPSGNLHLNLL
jgi:hypothetical protein